MKTLKAIAVLMVTAALFFSCELAGPEAYGTLVINSSGGSARAVTGQISNGFFEGLGNNINYIFECTNGNDTKTEGPYEVDKTYDVVIQLVPGTWVVSVKVYQGTDMLGFGEYGRVTIRAGQTIILGGIDVKVRDPYGDAIARKVDDADFTEKGYKDANDPIWKKASTVYIDRYMELGSDGMVKSSQPQNYNYDGKVVPHGTAKVLWDENYLYMLVLVEDATCSGKTGSYDHDSDSVEIFFNEKESSSLTDGNQYRINYTGTKKTYDVPDGKGSNTSKPFPTEEVNLSASTSNLPNGVSYAVVAKIKHSKGGNGGTIGIDFQINGAPEHTNGVRSSVAVWYDKKAVAWKDGRTYEGTLTLVN